MIRADKNPNTRGAQDMGLPAPATAAQLAAMAQAIEQGTIKVLYAIGVNLVEAFGAEAVATLGHPARLPDRADVQYGPRVRAGPCALAECDVC